MSEKLDYYFYSAMKEHASSSERRCQRYTKSYNIWRSLVKNAADDYDDANAANAAMILQTRKNMSDWVSKNNSNAKFLNLGIFIAYNKDEHKYFEIRLTKIS